MKQAAAGGEAQGGGRRLWPEKHPQKCGTLLAPPSNTFLSKSRFFMNSTLRVKQAAGKLAICKGQDLALEGPESA